jgi:heme/copper-type cytochrome/quinol oxidase subunit 3
MTTMTTLLYPLLQDPQARCNVALLHVYAHVCSLVWACLCLKIYWMFYLEILWSIFIPLKINNAMNNIYQLVLISCAILLLSSWPLIPPTTIPKSEKFRLPKRVWSQGFRIRDCVLQQFVWWRDGPVA